MSALARGFSQLVREGDTRALEFVVGCLMLLLGLQYAGGAIGLLVMPPSLVPTMPALVAMLSATMLIGGVLKLGGAILNDTTLRIAAAILGSVSWLYLALAVMFYASPLTTLLWVTLFLQSSWIYVRLSILKRQGVA